MPRSTSGDFVNWTSSYCTISTRLPYGSRKSSPRPGRICDAGRLERPARRLLVVDDEPEVPGAVGVVSRGRASARGTGRRCRRTPRPRSGRGSGARTACRRTRAPRSTSSTSSATWLMPTRRGGIACPGSRKDQVHVAELVPEIAALGSGPIGARRAAPARRPPRASAGARPRGSCQPVSRPSTDAQAALGRDDEARPAVAGRDRAVSAPRPSRARGRPSCRRRSPGRPSRARRSRAAPSSPGTRNRSGYGGSPSSGDETPVCSVDRRDAGCRARRAR